MTELSVSERKKNYRKVKTSWEKFLRDTSPHKRNTFAKFMKIVDKYGIDPDFFTIKEVNAITQVVDDNEYLVHNVEEGDNSTRKMFKHNPTHTLRGRFYQFTVKPMIRKAISAAHSYWISRYDKDAFVYDDPRLKDVDEFTRNFIDKHMAESDGAAYKIEFMHDIQDVLFGMVKEDPFYAAAFWAFCNEFVKRYPDGFEMEDSEVYNWEAHHHGKESD